jgi:hypothetical protein
MKKYYFLIIILTLLGLTSCIKQKNCDCEKKVFGKFVYYENPEEISLCGTRYKINAVIFVEDFTSPIFTIKQYDITGTIPKEYQVKDTIDVSACLKYDKSGSCVVVGDVGIYNLTCIEKEE